MYKCKYPTCMARLNDWGYCPNHQYIRDNYLKNKKYDKEKRDKTMHKFYNSAKWKRVRNDFLTLNPICNICKKEFANIVHHIKEAKQLNTDEERLDKTNLESLCSACHSRLHFGVEQYKAIDWDSYKKSERIIEDKSKDQSKE